MSVVKAPMEDDFTRAITGTTGGRGEVIEPHHDNVHEMNHHLFGQGGIWDCADDAARALLDEANMAFNFTNMFRGSRRVEIDRRDVITDLVELIVHEEELHHETSLVVDTKDAVNNEAKIGSFACRGVFNYD